MKLPENMYMLCGDEYGKFMDMTDDLVDYVNFYKVDMEDYDGIEFISLRKIIDRQIIDGNYINSIDVENS
jgi:hypothetical protein